MNEHLSGFLAATETAAERSSGTGRCRSGTSTERTSSWRWAASASPRVRWHDLRHFYASVCAAQGIDIDIDIDNVSTWLGHAGIQITQSTYVHLFQRSHSDAVSKLAAAAAVPAATPPRRIG